MPGGTAMMLSIGRARRFDPQLRVERGADYRPPARCGLTALA
jgi:hypothetical protein